jgi:tetratricopeptide (TPR) repeat protein
MTTRGRLAFVLMACGCYRSPHEVQRDWADKMTPKPFVAPQRAPPRFTVKVRAFVDGQYVSQSAHWQDRVQALIDRANAVSDASFGARFELLGISAWDHPELQALAPLLEQLRTEHPADDADLVVGFTSSLQIFTSTFEDLGMAELFGHHAVLRGIDQREQSDVILNELRTLSVDERVAVVHARIEHEETAVFLHEWGHCSGAIHDRSLEFIMSPIYSDKERDFSPAGKTSIQLALKHQRGDREAWLTEARAHLTSLPPSALARGVDEQIAAMFSSADGGTRMPAAGADPRPLAEADRKLFNIAVEKQRDGRAADAFGTLSSLLERYPKNPMVHTFACNLAIAARRADAAEWCTAAMEIAADDPRPAIALAWLRADSGQLPGARDAALEAKRRAALGKREPGLQAELGQALLRLGFLAYGEEEARRAELTRPAQEVLEAIARQRHSLSLPAGALPPDEEAAFYEAWQKAAGELHGRRGDSRASAAALVKQYPRLAGAWTLSCEMHLALGFSGDARGHCGRALQLDPASPRAHYLLACIDESERRRADAVGHLEKSIASDDSNEDAWRRLAALYQATHMDAARSTLLDKYQARFGRPLR